MIMITPYNPDNIKKWAMVAYWLYIFSFLVGFFSVIAVIIAYVFRDDVRGSFFESHFTYQIRTFWIGLLYFAIGLVLSLVFIGYFIFIFTFIWLLVRAIKGLRTLSKNQPILNEKTWLF